MPKFNEADTVKVYPCRTEPYYQRQKDVIVIIITQSQIVATYLLIIVTSL